MKPALSFSKTAGLCLYVPSTTGMSSEDIELTGGSRQRSAALHYLPGLEDYGCPVH